MKKNFFMFLFLPLAVLYSQIPISNGLAVSENFNSIGTTANAALPTNWKVDKNTTVRALGNYLTAVNTTERSGGINFSSSAPNGIYNFETGNGSTPTNRAIGGQSSGTGSQSVNIYAYFKNVGTSNISQIDISYDVMRFRNGSNPSGFSIQLYYSTDGVVWNSAGQNFLSSFSTNGDNNGAAVVPIEKKNILNQTLSGLSIPQNGSLYLAWNYSVTSGSITTNAQPLGIDNFEMNNIGGANTAPDIPVTSAPLNITKTSFVAVWNASSGATNYWLDVSTSPEFTEYACDYKNKEVGNVTTTAVAGLNPGTTYYYRVRASNINGTSSNSIVVPVTTLETITYIQFNGVSDTVAKKEGSYILPISIIDPSATNATTCTVKFIPDSSTARTSYLNYDSTWTVTFPANSSSNQNIALTISNNGVSELPKKVFFQIQNVRGGISARAGSTSKFILSITSGTDNSYYSTISSGLTGTELKAALHNLIKNQIKYPYTGAGNEMDVWKILKASDEDPKNLNNVIGIYSGLSIPKDPQSYWNREHVWSKSHGNFGTDIGAGTDGHHLRPENPTINTRKGNLDFDNGGVPYSFSPNCKVATITIDNNTTDISWEPRDAVKGDIARMIFYMATRYQGDPGEPNLQLVDYLPSAPTNKEPFYGKLSTLLQWNQQDRPDDFEMNRNNVIYYYQHNRNPFIDHPEWVNTIWGTPSQTDILNTIPEEYRLSQNYPNPFNPSSVISYQLPSAGFVSLKVYDLLGNEVEVLVNKYQNAGTYNSTFNTQNLPAGRQGSKLSSGIYFYQLKVINTSVSERKNFIQTKKMILLK